MREAAARLSQRYGVNVEPVMPPRADDLRLRAPRIAPPSPLAAICSTDDHDRAVHTYGRSFRDRIRAYNLQFPNPPDIVAYPTTEDEVTAVLDWCSSSGHAAIPYGGGSSTVAGFEPPDAYDGIVTIDLSALDQSAWRWTTSHAPPASRPAPMARALEAQLRPHGFTLRHYPQSFEFSSLGGWIATRSGGHYATNHTHIDDFVESVRMVTPNWRLGVPPPPRQRRRPQPRPHGHRQRGHPRHHHRSLDAHPGPPPVPRLGRRHISIASWPGRRVARRVVQAKLWPANCRLLDPGEAATAAGMDGTSALLILGFESDQLPQDDNIRQAVAIARDAGGAIDEADIRISSPDNRLRRLLIRRRHRTSGSRRRLAQCLPRRPLPAQHHHRPRPGGRDAGDRHHLGPLARHGRDGPRCLAGCTGPRLWRRLRILSLHPCLSRRPGALLHLGGHGTAWRRTGDVRRDQAGRLRRHHGRRRHHHPPPRRRSPAPPLVRPAAPRSLRRSPQAPPSALSTPTACSTRGFWWTSSPRSLAGKPLTKFRTTRYRRITVIYGIVSNGIRHDNHHTVEIRRPKIDDLENVGFPARFLGARRNRVAGPGNVGNRSWRTAGQSRPESWLPPLRHSGGKPQPLRRGAQPCALSRHLLSADPCRA